MCKVAEPIIRARSGFWRAQTKDARLMLCSGGTISNTLDGRYWLLDFVWCLEDAGRAQYRAHQIYCGAGLDSDLAFGFFFASLMQTHAKIGFQDP